MSDINEYQKPYSDQGRENFDSIFRKKTCPKCGNKHQDDWPLEIGDEVVEGGCQECWEAESSDKFWSCQDDQE